MCDRFYGRGGEVGVELLAAPKKPILNKVKLNSARSRNYVNSWKEILTTEAASGGVL